MTAMAGEAEDNIGDIGPLGDERAKWRFALSR